MDFRTAARRLGELTDGMTRAGGQLSTDMAMDPTMQDAHDPSQTMNFGQQDPDVDGLDPAMPGGPAPYNGAEPFSAPVASDPMWSDPKEQAAHDRRPVPHVEGPHEDITTLHDARRRSYEDRATRIGSR